MGTIAFAGLFLVRTTNMWLYVAVSIVGSLGFGLFNLIIWAFVTDIIDDQEVRTGSREDGTIYAVCSFSRKIGQAIASALGFGLAMTLFAGLREQLDLNNVPKAMKGNPIALITAGILAMAFMGFSGLV
jgi:Na+/melibiose symporter-like transporter